MTMRFINRILTVRQDSEGAVAPPRKTTVGEELLKREEDAERDFSLAPEVRRIAEDVEQIFARFLVEFLRAWQLLKHNKESGLLARFMKHLGQAFGQGVIILCELFGEIE